MKNTITHTEVTCRAAYRHAWWPRNVVPYRRLGECRHSSVLQEGLGTKRPVVHYTDWATPTPAWTQTQKWEEEKHRHSTGFEVRKKRLKYRATDNTQMYLTQTIRKVANVLSLTTPTQVHKHSMELMQYEICISIQKESVTAGMYKTQEPQRRSQ
jgi:hypothetical protein